MAKPVTAAELAEALRSVLTDMMFLGADEGTPLPESYDTAETLLARFDAQKRKPSKPALSEVEKAAVNVVNAHDVVGRISHRTVRGIEASVDSDKMIEALRDALKRVGAL